MKKPVGLIIIALTLLQFSGTVSFARTYSSYKSPKLYSSPKYGATPRFPAPKSNSNPRYIAPRKDLPVTKTEPVKPHFKPNGTFVPGYQRAPKNSLKPYYNPFYQKK